MIFFDIILQNLEKHLRTFNKEDQVLEEQYQLMGMAPEDYFEDLYKVKKRPFQTIFEDVVDSIQ